MVDEFGKRLRFEYEGQEAFEKFRNDLKDAKLLLADLSKQAAQIKSTTSAVKALTAATTKAVNDGEIANIRKKTAELARQRAEIQKIAVENKAQLDLETQLAKSATALAKTKRDARKDERAEGEDVRKKRRDAALDEQKLADAAVKRQRQQADYNLARFQKIETDKQQRLARTAALQLRTSQSQAEQQRKDLVLQQRLAQSSIRFRQQSQIASVRLEQAETRARQAALRSQQQSAASTRLHSNALTTAIGRTIRFFLLFKTVQEAIRLGTRSIGESIDFSALLEEAEIQVAGLLLSVGEVRDSFGEVVSVANAMPDAIALSGAVIKDLQRDAVNTAATFKELLSAFQVSVAPGLANGLNLDQIRELTVTFSQAAQALGVEQNQLAEEIRSTFQGSINIRNTRIAVALGISNEDIRAAKAAGNLYGFLQDRLSGVAQAANLLQDKLSLLRSNFQDILLIAGSQGITPLFEELKGLFRDLIGTFDEGSLEDGIQIKTSTVDNIRQVASGLASIVAGVREFVKSDEGAASIEAVALSLSQLTKAVGERTPEILEVLAVAIEALAKVTAAFVSLLDLVPDRLLSTAAAAITLVPYIRVILSVFSRLSSLIGIAGGGASAGGLIGSIIGLARAFGPIGVAVSFAAYVLTRDFRPALDSSSLALQNAERRAQRYQEAMQGVAAKLVSTRTDVKLSAEFMEEFSKRIKDAQEEASKFGLSEEQVDNLDILREKERALLEIEDKRSASQRALFETQEALKNSTKDSSSEVLELARAFSNLTQVQKEYNDAQTQVKTAKVSKASGDSGADNALALAEGRSTSAFLKLVNAEAEYKRVFQTQTDWAGEAETLSVLNTKLQEAKDNLERLVNARTLYNRERRGQGASGNINQDYQEQEAQNEQIRRETALVRGLEEAVSQSDARRGEISKVLLLSAESFLGNLSEEIKFKAELLAADKNRLEIEKEISELRTRLISLEDGRAKKSLEDTQNRLSTLRDEAELLRAKTSDPENKTLEIDFELRKKQLEISKEIQGVQEKIEFFVSAGVDPENETLNLLRARLEALSQISTFQNTIAQLKRDEANTEQGLSERDISRSKERERDLDLRRQSLALEEKIVNLRSGVDVEGTKISSAAEDFKVRQRSFDVELAISKLNKEFRDTQLQKLLADERLNGNLEQRQQLEQEILSLRLEQLGASAEERLLIARRDEEVRRENERLNPAAGFWVGLQASADARTPGTLASQLAEQTTQSLGEALKAALLGQGDAIGTFANQLGNAVLGALTQALAGKIAGLLLSLIGPGAAATGATPVPVPVPGVGQIIPNFNEGGKVPSSNIPKALPGHHPSDTTLVAAAEGEHILTKVSSKLLGHEFLAGIDKSLRTGSLSGEQARAAISERLRNNRSGPIRGYASGGPVGSSRPTVGTYTSGGSIKRPNSSLLVATPDQLMNLLNNPVTAAIVKARGSQIGIQRPEYF